MDESKALKLEWSHKFWENPAIRVTKGGCETFRSRTQYCPSLGTEVQDTCNSSFICATVF